MKLTTYIIRRATMLIPTLIGLSVIVFALSRVGGINTVIAAYINPHIPYAIQQKELIQEFHLNDPFWVQYFYYLEGLFKGNWGYTRTPVFSGPVTQAIAIFLPNTIQLSVVAFLIAILVAIPAGQSSAVRKDSWADQITRFIAFVGISLPVFWLAQLLSLAFATDTISKSLDVLPLAGTVNPTFFTGISWINSQGISSPTHIMIVDSLLHLNSTIFFSALIHVILPAATLSFTTIAPIIRYMRSSMVETLNQDYVRTARAKGIAERVVIRLHARRNALIPVVTVIGLIFATLLSGIVVIETIFNYPGMGYWTVQALLNYDTGGIMGVTIVFGLILVTTNFVVDLVYAYIDPRIRLGE